MGAQNEDTPNARSKMCSPPELWAFWGFLGFFRRLIEFPKGLLIEEPHLGSQGKRKSASRARQPNVPRDKHVCGTLLPTMEMDRRGLEDASPLEKDCPLST